MPRGDKTGPAGMGPMTGRAGGYCTGNPAPGFVRPAVGRGYWGRVGGRGWRRWFHATGLPGWVRAKIGYPSSSGPGYHQTPQYGEFALAMTAEQELDALRKQADFFQDELGKLNNRIEQLEAEIPK